MVKPIEKRSFGSFFGMVLAAVGGGVVVGLPAGLIGAILTGGGMSVETVFNAYKGLAIGIPIGAVSGVSMFSRVFKYPGSVWLAAVGSLAGISIFIGLVMLSARTNFNPIPYAMPLSFLLLPAFGTTTGFHSDGLAKRLLSKMRSH